MTILFLDRLEPSFEGALVNQADLEAIPNHRTVYVSNSGDDNSPGSENSPVATIANAVQKITALTGNGNRAIRCKDGSSFSGPWQAPAANIASTLFYDMPHATISASSSVFFGGGARVRLGTLAADLACQANIKVEVDRITSGILFEPGAHATTSIRCRVLNDSIDIPGLTTGVAHLEITHHDDDINDYDQQALTLKGSRNDLPFVPIPQESLNITALPQTSLVGIASHRVIYVSNAGANKDSGLHPNLPKQTLNAAILAAITFQSSQPAEDGQFPPAAIVCLDSSTFNETIPLGDGYGNIQFWMPHAEVSGLSITPGVTLYVRTINGNFVIPRNAHVEAQRIQGNATIGSGAHARTVLRCNRVTGSLVIDPGATGTAHIEAAETGTEFFYNDDGNLAVTGFIRGVSLSRVATRTPEQFYSVRAANTNPGGAARQLEVGEAVIFTGTPHEVEPHNATTTGRWGKSGAVGRPEAVVSKVIPAGGVGEVLTFGDLVVPVAKKDAQNDDDDLEVRDIVRYAGIDAVSNAQSVATHWQVKEILNEPGFGYVRQFNINSQSDTARVRFDFRGKSSV